MCLENLAKWMESFLDNIVLFLVLYRVERNRINPYDYSWRMNQFVRKWFVSTISFGRFAP